MSDANHAPDKGRRKSIKRVPRGEFVWVLSGKTHHPARLMIPRAEIEFEPTDEVEIKWTQTGILQWVEPEDISHEEQSTNRQQRSSRRAPTSVSPGKRKGTAPKPRAKRTPRKTAKAKVSDQKRILEKPENESKKEPPAKKQKIPLTKGSIIPPQIVEKDEEQAQTATERVLDSIPTPLFDVARSFVSGLLELCKGFLPSSSS